MITARHVCTALSGYYLIRGLSSSHYLMECTLSLRIRASDRLRCCRHICSHSTADITTPVGDHQLMKYMDFLTTFVCTYLFLLRILLYTLYSL